MALTGTLSRALAIRRAHFHDIIRFSAPSFKHYETRELASSSQPKFAAISITGPHCALGCEHCRGRLLLSMTRAETPETLRQEAIKLVERGCRGLLISGGCDRKGRVPLEPFLPVISELRHQFGLAIAVHPGLADAALARGLVDAGVERTMIDLVGDSETARSVLHLDVGPESFEETLATLTEAGLAVTPHIVAGLHYGSIRGEESALEMATRYPVAAVVIVVVRPEPGTPFIDVSPPNAAAVAELMAQARISLPRTPLSLGCARPLGLEARALENFALRAGFNGIAFPADRTVRLARALGFKVEFAEQCCVFE